MRALVMLVLVVFLAYVISTESAEIGSDREVFRHVCWRPQVSQRCGVHSVNNLLCLYGLERVREASCHENMEAEEIENLLLSRGVMPKSRSGGGYDYGLNRVDLERDDAFIVNPGGHWVAYVKLGGQWYNTDSLNSGGYRRASDGQVRRGASNVFPHLIAIAGRVR
jgi:hypothetical protein